MDVRVEYGELDLRGCVKSAGGMWNKQRKVRELPYKKILELGLSERVVGKTN